MVITRSCSNYAFIYVLPVVLKKNKEKIILHISDKEKNISRKRENQFRKQINPQRRKGDTMMTKYSNFGPKIEGSKKKS